MEDLLKKKVLDKKIKIKMLYGEKKGNDTSKTNLCEGNRVVD